MKNFLSKNWKKILIVITIIFIVINIVNKVIAPHILVSEFGKYGPDVEKSEMIINTDKIVNETNSFISNSSDSDITRIIIILVVGLLAAVIISDLGEKKSAPKKK